MHDYVCLGAVCLTRRQGVVQGKKAEEGGDMLRCEPYLNLCLPSSLRPSEEGGGPPNLSAY